MGYKEKVIALLNSQELSKEQKEKLENIFPEIKESEDERIRKELIEQVAYITPNNDELDDELNTLPTYQKRIDKYRAWLEKQGKQKQTWEPNAAQLIVIKDLIEDKNTSKANRVILRGMFEELKQITNSQSPQFSSGHLLDPDKVIEWLECKAFQSWAIEINIKQIVDKFKKDFEI